MRLNRVGVAIAACALLLGGLASAQDNSPVKGDGTRMRMGGKLVDFESATPGVVRLPDGRKVGFQLCIKERKDKTFTGMIVYNLGLRQQPFEVEGTIEKGRMTWQEKSEKGGLIHPHSPVLGGGKFETTGEGRLGTRGVAYLHLKRNTDAISLWTKREPVKCEFVLGAFTMLEADSGK
jgi:hypothetical protein